MRKYIIEKNDSRYTVCAWEKELMVLIRDEKMKQGGMGVLPYPNDRIFLWKQSHTWYLLLCYHSFTSHSGIRTIEAIILWVENIVLSWCPLKCMNVLWKGIRNWNCRHIIDNSVVITLGQSHCFSSPRPRSAAMIHDLDKQLNFSVLCLCLFLYSTLIFFIHVRSSM